MIAIFLKAVQKINLCGLRSRYCIFLVILMSLIKHNCNHCGADLEFPEQLSRVACPQCHDQFLVEVYEDVVSLKWLKDAAHLPKVDLPETNQSKSEALSLIEQLKILDQQIYEIDRKVKQRRSSASSSFLVAFMFFFFAFSGLLINRIVIAVCCGTISTAMIWLTGSTLQESARSRKSLAVLVYQREQLAREISFSQPRIF
jgi:DNA-directed RNA polymerase subunit RPC12/RpoP